MAKFFDANYKITNIKTENGDIVELHINNKNVDFYKLEDNKDYNIDVSEYQEPVVIIPSQNKDGMKQTTVRLNNYIKTLFAWSNDDETIYTKVIPTVDGVVNILVGKNESQVIGHTLHINDISVLQDDIGNLSDNVIRYNNKDFERDINGDITI